MRQLVKTGDQLPPITKKPNEVDLFLFSAAVWNAHRIHYEREYARAEGHRDVVVQGSLQANWLVESMLSWSPGATLLSLSFRNTSTAFVNETFVVGGRVAEVREESHGTRVVVDLQAEGPSGVTTVGRGTLRLPPDAAGDGSSETNS